MLRRIVGLLGIGLVAFGLNGCGDSVEDGVPANVYMTKD